jgi:hypothetical protein
MRIGISGHRGLPGETARLVGAEIREALRPHDPAALVGVSCLADGADQIFARAVLEHGGRLAVVAPAKRYRAGLPPACWPDYDDLFARAAQVRRLAYVESDADAHMAASAAMLAAVDELYAVWDGKPARSYGGTADVVALAREMGVPVRVFWPDGSTRD